MKHFVYITKILTEGQTFLYAGKHSTKDVKDGYIGSGTILRTIKENDPNATFDVIDRAFVDTESLSFELEELVVEALMMKYNCINIAEGGYGWFMRYADEEKLNEWKKKLSIAQTGKKASKEARQKMSQAGKGRKQSNEHIRKRTEGQKGSKRSDAIRQKMKESSAWKDELPWIRAFRMHPNSATTEAWYHLEELYQLYSQFSGLKAAMLRKLAIYQGLPITKDMRLEGIVGWFENGNIPSNFKDKLPRK